MTHLACLAFLWLCTTVALVLDAAEMPGAPDGSEDVFVRVQVGLHRALQEECIASLDRE